MSSFTSSKDRFRVFGAMALVGFVALCIGNQQASCQLIPSANGSQAFLSAPIILTGGSENATINVGSVTGSSQLYDVNGVVTLSNASPTAAQTITTQYFVNGVAASPLVTTSLAGGAASTTLALPQQLTGQPTSAAVSLHISNTTGTANVTIGTGSTVTVSGYTSNNGTPTVSAPGSQNLSANFNPVSGSTPPFNVTPLTVNVPLVASAQGLYSLNGSLFINNTSGATQTVNATYTVDGSSKGQTFAVTLPSTGTMMSMPMQLSGLTPGPHNVSINVSGSGGNGFFSVGAGSSISVTSYNATGTTPSATATQVVNVGLGAQTGILNTGFIPPSNGGAPFQITVPTNATAASFYDATAVLMLFNPTNNTSAQTITAQFLVNNAVVSTQAFTTVLGAAAGSVAELYMPQQFATLAAGSTLAVQLTDSATVAFNIEADSLTLIAHNNVPNAATPEPASISLAAMAMMAFGAAAYRKRRAGRVQVQA